MTIRNEGNMVKGKVATHTSRVFGYKNRANVVRMPNEFPDSPPDARIPHADNTLWATGDDSIPQGVDRECVYRRLGA